MSYRAPLAGLPGATTGLPVRQAGGRTVDPTAVPDGALRNVNEDGTIELRARSGRHLMVHIFETLRDNERELFTEQVLSDATRAEFVERGIPPERAFDALKAREADIQALFNAIPQGEYTPGVFWRKVGDRTYRLRAPGRRGEQLPWNFIDMVQERGQYRLRWFGRD